MSTQDDIGISFEVHNEQQNFRFIEFPPQLLELITTQKVSKYVNFPTQPPFGKLTCQSLYLKSSKSEQSGGAAQAPTNAVLCTDSQTFQVRQVQSSNSVFVVQSAESTPRTNDVLPSSSLSAIAQCAVTLELNPTSPSPVEFLKQSVPTYAGPESIPAISSVDKTDRATLLANAPFSSREFDEAWKGLCYFELHGQAWQPASSLLANVWKSALSAATLRGVELSGTFATDPLQGIVEEDGHPGVLFQAVVGLLRLEDDLNIIDGRKLTV